LSMGNRPLGRAGGGKTGEKKINARGNRRAALPSFYCLLGRKSCKKRKDFVSQGEESEPGGYVS